MKKQPSIKTISSSIIFLLFGIVLMPIVSLAGDSRAGKLTADIDRDGKAESVQWKKFASNNLGSYYQLVVIDDNGRLLWKGPRDSRDNNPYVFSSLHTGKSLPQLLFDIDGDGYTELLAPEPQGDVSPTYYRKLRWTGRTFEHFPSRPLIMKDPGSDYFTWVRGQHSYGIWVSKFRGVTNKGLVKADITYYDRNGVWKGGVALLRFTSTGAVVHRWIKPLAGVQTNTSRREVPVAKKRIIGTVYGLDPNGDGFLSVRRKPNSKEIGRLYNGDRVEILGRSGKWYKIKDIKSRRVGWSHSNWIRVR